MKEPPPDLRLPALALCAWASAIATNLVKPEARTLVLVLEAALSLILIRRSPAGSVRRTTAAVAVLWIVVSIGVTLRGAIVHDSWVSVMAKERASAQLTVEIRGDPKVQPGMDEDRAIVRATVLTIEARAKHSSAHVPATLILKEPQAKGLRVGAHYALNARLAPSPYQDTAATVIVSGSLKRIRDPSWVARISGHVRDAIQRASAGQTRAAGLVPALVDGDERALPAGVKDDFQASGLSHLLAVSGTNFVLLGSAWLGFARLCGVRGRALIPIGLVGIVALVLLARAEPSVVRAAVMGGVALIGLGTGQRGQGVRALSACICMVM
ncbi:MAG TPA: ComEC/Rec2 family competence protein, partial [Marmoricola sp.]|nr:ComEC/Rec2 family competence protein [Marmoricola sp.]